MHVARITAAVTVVTVAVLFQVNSCVGGASYRATCSGCCTLQRGGVISCQIPPEEDLSDPILLRSFSQVHREGERVVDVCMRVKRINRVEMGVITCVDPNTCISAFNHTVDLAIERFNKWTDICMGESLFFGVKVDFIRFEFFLDFHIDNNKKNKIKNIEIIRASA